MNGFVNTILSVMFSWIRALISNIWTVLSSEDGGALFQFLSSHWLTMVVVLCVVCVLVDGLVYFFRWRPDYVWASKWRRLRRRRSRRAEEAPGEPMQPQEAFYAYQPTQETAPAMAYAPLQPAAQPTQVWTAHMQEAVEEPVFDEALWDSEELPEDDWQVDAPAYGAPQPEPLAYFRDVQAGFAPAIPPEQLYAPSSNYQPQPEPEAAPVHPGLDEETVRQSMGLEESGANPYASPVMRAPVFRPFTVTHEPEEPEVQTAFQRFAQRARDFMAMDESERKTIRDLQSNVDVSKAFHEPVYPQSYDRSKE